MRIPIKFHVQLPIGVKQESKWFISWCPVLDLFSQGETHDKAIENMIEAIQLFLKDCLERGTIGEVLRQQGFREVGGAFAAPDIDLPKHIELVDVPVPFFVERRPEELCLA